jgi:hypothetical protein
MENVERWTSHSLMSDPAHHTVAIAGFPSDIGVLNGIIQGVLIHSDWLIDYNSMRPGFTLPRAQHCPSPTDWMKS